jgi:phosphate uptake regulator
MEQTSDKIVARDFLDMKDISISNLIRKMDTITRAMIEDGVKSFSEDNYESILHRDKDVNRLSYLIFRTIRYGFQNQTFMQKKYSLDSMQLMNHYFITFNIEAVADEAKRIARYMKSIEKLNQKEKKEFEKIYTDVRKSYLDTMKAYYTKDFELGYEVASRKKGLIQDSEDFFLRNRNVKWAGYLTNRMKRMISSVHKLGRIVYQ